MKLIDWSERFPNESARDIAVRQSTICPCGNEKEIGERDCGHEPPDIGFTLSSPKGPFVPRQ